MMHLVLFDADGTMVDSLALIHECMRRTFLEFDQPEPNRGDTSAIVGLTLNTAIATMLDRSIDAHIEAMTSRYKEIYTTIAHLPEFKSALFPGIEELVLQLADLEDVLIGMVTGKSRRGVDMLLDTHGFRSHFVTSRCADDCPSKPHPAMVLECCAETGIDPTNTVVIGDTSFDVAMASNAGATAIGVDWGYHPVTALQEAGAHHIANDATHLAGLVHSFRQQSAG